MKKTMSTIAIATGLIAASNAYAAGVELGVAYEDHLNTADSAAVFVRPFLDVVQYQVGLRLLSSRDVKTGEMYTYVEPQVTRMFPIGASPVAVGATASLGLLSAKSDSYTYGSIEPKVAYTVNDKLTFGAGARYRNSFDSQIKFESWTYSVGASYKLTKATSVTVAGFEKNLDERSTGVILSVTQDF
jgi:predicted porin